MSTKIFVLAVFTFWMSALSAQSPKDSLRLNLADAEGLFLKGNFLLLAQKYNIQAQKAQEIQAKLYPNPNFSIFYSILTRPRVNFSQPVPAPRAAKSQCSLHR